MTTYLRVSRPEPSEDTIYEVLGSAVRGERDPHPEQAVIWTRTISGYGHVQNGRIRTWSKRELMIADIYAIPAEEAV